MSIHLGFWDVLLVLVVSLQATAMAYIPQPRLKAFAYFLPFPFTLATLSLGRNIDASNVIGIIALIVYINGVRILYRNLRLPIVAAIVIAAATYSLIGYLLSPIIPTTDLAFWLACAGMLALAVVLYLKMPPRHEPSRRTQLPVYVKLPIIAAVVTGLVIVKGYLGGFMTLFPMVGVVGAYEARYSLWSLARQLPTWIIAVLPMMAVVRLTQASVGLGPALILGWVVFLAVLLPLTRRQWSHQAPAPAPANATAPQPPS